MRLGHGEKCWEGRSECLMAFCHQANETSRKNIMLDREAICTTMVLISEDKLIMPSMDIIYVATSLFFKAVASEIS